MKRCARAIGTVARTAALLAWTIVGPFTAAGQEPGQGAPLMMMKSSGGKVDFTSLDDARGRAGKGPTVLFFAADWCPTCQTAMRDIDSHVASLGSITVVVVDYDRSRDLKRKYGVTYQHTFVQIDAEAGKVTIWSGGGVEEILRRVTGNS